MLTSPAIKTVAPKMDPERSNLIEIILMCLIIVLFSWFVLKPKAIFLAQKRVELKNIEDQRAMLADKKKQFDSLVNKMEGAQRDFAVLDEALPLQPRATKLLLLVETLAKTSGMTVTAVSLDGSEAAKFVAAADKVSLESPYTIARKLSEETTMITMSGSLEQFMSFLNGIENSTRLLDVQSIEITSDDQGQLGFKVKVQGYVFSS